VVFTDISEINEISCLRYYYRFISEDILEIDPPACNALKDLGKIRGEDYWLTASIWSGRFFLLKNSL